MRGHRDISSGVWERWIFRERDSSEFTAIVEYWNSHCLFCLWAPKVKALKILRLVLKVR